MKLVLLAPLIPDAIIDLRYASVNNIVGKILYDNPEMATARLEAETAPHLVQAAHLLREQSLRIVIWDAYRPATVQQTLRLINNDNNYVQPISNHSKGKAIDLTLVDSGGVLLDMGTDFDEFSLRAHTTASGLTSTQANNRKLLLNTMERAGFTSWPFEWWHFNYVSES